MSNKPSDRWQEFFASPETSPDRIVSFYADGRVEWKEGLTAEQKINALAQLIFRQTPRAPTTGGA